MHPKVSGHILLCYSKVSLLIFYLLTPLFSLALFSLLTPFLIKSPAGANVNEHDEHRLSALHYAVMFRSSLLQKALLDQWNTIQQMIQLYKGEIGVDGQYEDSLLYFAISGGNHFFVNQLLEKGFSPNLHGTIKIMQIWFPLTFLL